MSAPFTSSNRRNNKFGTSRHNTLRREKPYICSPVQGLGATAQMIENKRLKHKKTIFYMLVILFIHDCVTVCIKTER